MAPASLGSGRSPGAPKASLVRSVGFMNAGITDPEVRKKKLNAEFLGTLGLQS